MDELYDVPCRIVHVTTGSKLKDHMDTVKDHFTKKGSPIMMGGDSDNMSKGIVGICQSDQKFYLLVVVS